MKLKPFRDYSEHDVINLFSLDTANGEAGLLVKVAGSGFINNRVHGIAHNMNPHTPNVFTPRWEVKPKVTRTTTGEAPLGFTLYPVREDLFGFPNAYHRQLQNEAQAVVSGDAVPVIRKGLFLVGELPSGQVPAVGKVAVPGPTGSWAVANAGTAKAFGVFLGSPDADGYTLVAIDFNNSVF